MSSSRFSVDCHICGTWLIGRTMQDVDELLKAHRCAAVDRNKTLAFGVPVTDELTSEAVTLDVFTDYLWRDRLTVEDARLLHSMRIDPL